ncbi:uncharacterized protein TNCV_3892481 [Trichonephila clavipes]|nr:uncharacterized protein TNCV_3892481 [Trichonephila clavipes]
MGLNWHGVTAKLHYKVVPEEHQDWNLRVDRLFTPSPFVYHVPIFSYHNTRKMGLLLSLRQVELLYDRWRNHLSPPSEFRHGTGGEGNILQPPALVVSAATAHKSFRPTDLTTTYSVCTRGVFGGIGHRTQAFRFGDRCSKHYATHGQNNDEAHFWLNGYVNKQNCRIWSEANPQVYLETPLHPEKLTVWCTLWVGGIILQKR